MMNTVQKILSGNEKCSSEFWIEFVFFTWSRLKESAWLQKSILSRFDSSKHLKTHGLIKMSAGIKAVRVIVIELEKIGGIEAENVIKLS